MYTQHSWKLIVLELLKSPGAQRPAITTEGLFDKELNLLASTLIENQLAIEEFTFNMPLPNR